MLGIRILSSSVSIIGSRECMPREARRAFTAVQSALHIRDLNDRRTTNAGPEKSGPHEGYTEMLTFRGRRWVTSRRTNTYVTKLGATYGFLFGMSITILISHYFQFLRSRLKRIFPSRRHRNRPLQGAKCVAGRQTFPTRSEIILGTHSGPEQNIIRSRVGPKFLAYVDRFSSWS